MDLVEWISLGARLLATNPRQYGRVMGALRRIVEGHELLEESERTFADRPARRSSKFQA